tara:strand:+ start:2310 stop:3380 length:1071 start_codon:yes stop_codon:yes gene_type:complete
MFCIAAFIIFVILGIFSARYRKLAKKAWSCVARKITFRPCEIGFKEEEKNVLIGKLILTKPRLAKFLDKWIEIFATIFVILSIWSLLVVFQSGLNLLVYDTCYPKNVESCSLGGEACGVSTGGQTFFEAAKNLELLTWTKDETVFLVKTVSRIPDRFKNWKPEEYIGGSATYYVPFDPQKKVALEIIDPGCKFCAKLWKNIKTAEFENKYNLTYIPYAIPDTETPSGFKFPNSPLVISYLEAVKIYPLDSEIPADWQILERLFLGKTPEGASYQENFNLLYSKKEAEDILIQWLEDVGYSNEQIKNIQKTAQSTDIKKTIETQVKIVEDEIRTIKIPTIIFDERRYDRVIGPEKLK